jgi:hypothetical protein
MPRIPRRVKRDATICRLAGYDSRDRGITACTYWRRRARVPDAPGSKWKQKDTKETKEALMKPWLGESVIRFISSFATLDQTLALVLHSLRFLL